jgi:hypothetical protein
MRFDRRCLLKAPMLLGTSFVFEKLALGAATDFEEFTAQAGKHAIKTPSSRPHLPRTPMARSSALRPEGHWLADRRSRNGRS